MAEKITTIEELAAMVKRGFNTLATKDDLKALETKVDSMETKMASKDDLKALKTSLETRLDHLDARVGRIEQDIHEIREEAVDPLQFQDMLGRMKYVERKMGIESGV